MMNKLITTLFAALALSAGLAGASGGDDIRLEPAPINRLDNESLQRGARTFVNYCLNCHSAKYMRYNVLTRIGLTEEQIKDNLILTGAKIADPMKVAMTYDEARNWFGAIPPDLSVESRVRGTDWLYNYFLGFYQDEKSATGWNNLVFPNVAMPHVLWELSGTNRLVATEYKDPHEAQGAAIAAKQLVRVAALPGGKAAVETLAVATPGTLTPVEYRALVADLVNYLDFMGEPVKNQRIKLGLVVLIFLGVLFIFAFWLKKEYWKDVH
jgi:ubiquinol-cytochrome c reductase cytochrome c1 subunit